MTNHDARLRSGGRDKPAEAPSELRVIRTERRIGGDKPT